MWQDYVIDLEQIRVQNVIFEPGARTDWHAHPDGQVILVTAGEGRIETVADGVVTLRAGDVIYAPPDEAHWHGAGADTSAVLMAFSLGRQPRWGDAKHPPE